METPQISPMTAAWSLITASPCSRITYTCNRPPQAPKPLPSSVFLSCVRCQQCWWCWWARVPGLSAVTCVVPQWCCLHCHHTTTIIPGATSTQYCTVLHCTVLLLQAIFPAGGGPDRAEREGLQRHRGAEPRPAARGAGGGRIHIFVFSSNQLACHQNCQKMQGDFIPGRRK